VSNSLAVATVTAVISQLLSEALADAPDGSVQSADVTTMRPDMLATTDGEARGINVFLYQVSANPSWAAADLPTRRGDATPVTKPQQALDLHYLLTFSGDEMLLEPQRLLGTAISTMVARPVLSRERVRGVIERAVAGDTWEQFSDLAEQIDVVRLTWLPLNLEELSKLWSTFLQAPYRLSITYQATVVLVEGEVFARPALPVLTRGADVAALQLPVVTSAFADSSPTDPVRSGTTLRIEGRRLRGAYRTLVRLGDREVAVPPEQVSDTRLTVDLPAEVRAGVIGVQVAHPRLVGTPGVERGGAESAAVPLVVRPSVTATATSSGAVGGSVLTLQVAPPVARRQRVLVLLNEHRPPANRPARGYVLTAPPAEAGDPDPRPSVRVPAPEVVAGTYVVRVQVDGAESVLETATGVDGRFDAPRVTVP
jgi:hypothetical protein